MKECESVQLRKLPLEYSFEWMRAAWRIYQAHYRVLIPPVLLLVLVIFASISIGGYSGIALGRIFEVLLYAGSVLLVHDIVLGKNPRLARFFEPFTNPRHRDRLVPIFIVSLGSGFIVEAIQLGIRPGAPLEWISGIPLAVMVDVAVLVLTWFSVPQMLFENRAFPDTISCNIEALRRNALTLGALLLLVCTALLVCLAALLLPVVFVGLPLAMPLSYLTYASIFQELKPREVLPDRR